MQPEFKQMPQTNMSFIGLRRSGNHALIDWIFGHHKNWSHYNNCTLDENGQSTYYSKMNTQNGDDEEFALASYEDYDLKCIEEHLPEPRILLLRDPFNLFASRLQIVRQYIENEDAMFTHLDLISDTGFEMWKSYARAFLKGDGYIKINFNLWYESVDYRKDTADRLGFTFTDKKFLSKDGWRYSGGSSFGGDPDPLNSHKHMEHDEEFLSFFDEDIFELSAELGFCEPNFKWSRPDGYASLFKRIAGVDGQFEFAKDVVRQAIKCFPQSSLLKQRLAFMERVNLM